MMISYHHKKIISKTNATKNFKNVSSAKLHADSPLLNSNILQSFDLVDHSSWNVGKGPDKFANLKIASYRRQKPQPSQWVRLERAFAENPYIGLSDGEFKILKIPKP